MKYQLSHNGISWYYHNGTSWVSASGSSQTNTAAQVQTNAGTFHSQVGAGTVYFKAFLDSASGAYATELDNISIQGTK